MRDYDDAAEVTRPRAKANGATELHQATPPDMELPPISAYLTDVERTKANGSRGKTEPPTTQSHYLPWNALSQREPPPRRWFMSEWLTTGATILAGRGGTGKTALAQTMASRSNADHLHHEYRK